MDSNPDLMKFFFYKLSNILGNLSTWVLKDFVEPTVTTLHDQL